MSESKFKKDAPAVVHLENISLSRNLELLLNDVSWRVNQGEHWVLLGANGAGKTLLLKILMGYLWPTRGKVEILGQTLGQVDVRELRRQMGWVARALEDMIPPQEPVMDVILSGPEGSLGLYGQPETVMVDKARSLLGEFGLVALAERHFGLLSAGEKQRTLLARAIMTDPAILFLDEPMSNLDLGGRERFLSLLESLATRPQAPTIILTTHNTTEIGPFMTHALLLKQGKKVASGLLEEVMQPAPLGAAFDLPLQVERTVGGRYLAYL